MTFIGSLLAWPFRFLAHVLLQPDKQSHFYWGCSMGLSGLVMGWWGMSVVIACAGLKEIYDLWHPPHQCEAWDFLMTTIGGAVAIQLITMRLHHV